MDKHNHLEHTFGTARREFSKDIRNIKDKACETCDAVTDTAHHLQQNTKEAISSSLDGIRESQEDVIVYIQRNPIKTVFYAFLAGFFAAKFL